MELDERIERANPVPVAAIPQPASADAERIYRAALDRLVGASPRPTGRTWKRADRPSSRVAKRLTPGRELGLLASLFVVMAVLAFSPIPRLVLGHSTTPGATPNTTTTGGGQGRPSATPRVFDGIIIVEPPPAGYQPRVSKEEVLARYTGPSTLAAGASSLTVFLGTVTDTGYTRDGRPVIDHRVAWVLYAVGVQETAYGCGLPGSGSTATTSPCPSSVSAQLVEIVNPVNGNMIDATEY